MKAPVEISSVPVFHDGEVEMHNRLGTAERTDGIGRRMIRTYMPDQHREFFENLRSIHLCAVDGTGQPWAIMRTGIEGFIKSPDEKTLIVDSTPLASEPADLQLNIGDKIGIVGIELSTRRRNRMNAVVVATNANQLTLKVEQSFGNCPQYIQKRETVVTTAPKDNEITKAAGLSDPAAQLIERADTLFIASRAAVLNTDPRAGLDINHRGGPTGFVEVHGNEICFPDYKGNNFYNTLGNILLDDRVGLQFIEFSSGTLLNVQGRAEIIDHERSDPPFMGRMIKISVEKSVLARSALSQRFEFIEASPKNPT